MEDYKIEVFTKDAEDDCYCAIVLRYNGTDWFNTGIVVRAKEVIGAFATAVKAAKAAGFWE